MDSLPFDPKTVASDVLAELFPDIGIFVAEDIVEWRRKNDGVFPDEATLVSPLGLPADLAKRVSIAAARELISEHPPPEPIQVRDSEIDPHAPSLPAAVVVQQPVLPPVSDQSSAEASSAAPATSSDIPPTAPTPRTQSFAIGLGLLLVILGIAGGAYAGERRASKPIAAIREDVAGIKAEQGAARERGEDTKAQLAETQKRLDEQERSLAEAKARLAKTEARLDDGERKARDLDTREARDIALSNSRLSHVERKALKLDEAMKLIDAMDPESK